MNDDLEQRGWVNYRVGCSCQGKPKYYNNADLPGIIIIIKGDTFTVRQNGVEIHRGDSSNFNSIMIDNGIFR